MTRGFVTLAVGKESYYKLANNLLYSYRNTNTAQLPWTIVCDRENKWTADFDSVILLDQPSPILFGQFLSKQIEFFYPMEHWSNQ